MDVPKALPAKTELDQAGRGLSLTTQQHLGKILRRSYLETVQTTPERIAGLLVTLQLALEDQAGADERAFHAELTKLLPNLQKFAMSLARDSAVADDLVQDTALKAWRSRTRFELGTNMGAWLFTILRNVFYSNQRRNKYEVPDVDGNHASRLGTVPEQPGQLDLSDAQVALGKLPPIMREALILVAIEDLSYEQAAAVMGCKIGTVKSRVWRAREQLAITLGYNGSEVGNDVNTVSALNAIA